jgi:hypothetical protein
LCKKREPEDRETHKTVVGGVKFRSGRHTHRHKGKRKYANAALVTTSQEIVAVGFSFGNECVVDITAGL